MRWWTKPGNRGDAQPDAAEARDLLLSAYLDGDLDETGQARFEQSLAADGDLREALDGLRDIVAALGALDELRAPRPFTLAAPPTLSRRLTRLETGARFGAIAAAVAFVVVVGADLRDGGGTTAASRETVALSASDLLDSAASTSGAAMPPMVGVGQPSGSSDSAGSAPERTASGASDAAAPLPTTVATTFAVQPTPAATATPASTEDRRLAQQGATPAGSRTPVAFGTSTSTTTSALQGTPPPIPAGTPAVGADASVTPGATTAVAPAAPAQVPARTPAPVTPTPPGGGAPGSGGSQGVTASPIPDAPGSAAAGSGSGSAGSGAVAQPALPPVATEAASGDSPSAPSPAPDIGGQQDVPVDEGPTVGKDLIGPVPAFDPGSSEAAGELRVTVTRRVEVDALRTAEFGLGALALGLTSTTAWLWYARRRQATAGGA